MRRPYLLAAAAVVLIVIAAILVWSPNPKPSASKKVVPVTPTSVPVTTVPAPVISAPLPTTTSPTTTVPVPITQPVQPGPLASDDLRQMWSRVAVCESGDASFQTYGYPAYPDSLGINAQNWAQFGGGSDVSAEAQIAVAEKFRAYYGIPIPDQNGCAAW
jgi:Transglycosylase-like domain